MPRQDLPDKELEPLRAERERPGDRFLNVERPRLRLRNLRSPDGSEKFDDFRLEPLVFSAADAPPLQSLDRLFLTLKKDELQKTLRARRSGGTSVISPLKGFS
jgi:hypothetical protein